MIYQAQKIFLFLLLACLSFSRICASDLTDIRSLLDSGETEAALITLNALDATNQELAETDFLFAYAYQIKNDLKAALKYASSALRKAPDVSDNQMIYAETQGLILAEGSGGIFKKLGLVKHVKRSFEAAVKLDPNNIRARSGLAQFYIMAPSIAGGSKKKALQQAQAIYALDKAAAYPLLAQVYRKQNNLNKTRATLSEWQLEYPGNWNAVMANAYFEQSQNEFEKSHILIKAWLEKKPNHLAANYQLGRLAALSGKHLDAGVTVLQKYIEQANENPTPPIYAAHWRLAMIYQQQNKMEKAKKEVAIGLALEPNNDRLQQLESILLE